MSIQLPGEAASPAAGLVSGSEPRMGLKKDNTKCWESSGHCSLARYSKCCSSDLGGVQMVLAIHALNSGSAKTSKASSCLEVLVCG